ncbi:hypothetical protein N9B82_03530 [Saprospiraceae bacterium]|nr:hypothetical protein [Saprospiraceae bacterium]
MKTSRFNRSSFSSNLIFLGFLLLMISCAPKEANKAVEPPILEDKVDESEPQRVLVAEDSHSMPAPPQLQNDGETGLAVNSPAQTMESIPPSVEQKPQELKVVFTADSIMYLGQTGIMSIWLGAPEVDVAISQGMVKDEQKITSSIGRFAKIRPNADDFEITNLRANVCHKIDPGGSEIRFLVKPKDEGQYRVSAEIDLYETEDCTGISVPKTARILTVSVKVNMSKEISKKIHWMEREAWDKFSVFWIALVTLIFGAAIFVIRRFVKNQTGYEDPTTKV